MEQRPLCTAEDNTCPNLAEIKGKLRSGGTRYGRFCDSHRRRKHAEVTTPTNRRFIPLNACEMCLSERAAERHRIIQGGEYKSENIICLCQSCHQKIHRFYKKLAALGATIKLTGPAQTN